MNHGSSTEPKVSRPGTGSAGPSEDVSVQIDRNDSDHSDTKTRPLRVLHALAVSLPHQNGYTVRSKYIIEQQVANGWNPVVVTSPFYAGNPASIEDEVRNGVTYRRIPHPIDLAECRTSADRWGSRAHRMRQACRERARLMRKRWAKTRRWGSRKFAWVGRLLRRRTKPAVHQAGRFKRWLERRFDRFGAFVVPRIRAFGRIFRPVPGARAIGAGGAVLARMTRRATIATIAFVARSSWTVVRWILRGVGFVLRSLGVVLWAIIEGIGSLFQPLTPARMADRLSEWLRNVEERQLLRRYRTELERICREVRPDVIHAHSPYRNALPASRVARTLGIPFVYEVRGLWEESGVASGNFLDGSSEYKRWRALETNAMRSADVLVVICEQLRDEAVRRGVRADRIFITPNAADPGLLVDAADNGDPDSADENPAPTPEEQTLLDEVAGRLHYPTVGYVGSLRKLEGVAELLHGAAALKERGHDVSLLVVGDGPELPILKELAEELGIADRSVFTGRVSHHLVRAYYELIQVFVVSRPDQRVARMVTPLKPLEAMALGKALIVSDLPALRELVHDDLTGLCYPPGEPNALAERCEELLFNEQRQRKLGAAARDWVRNERTWAQTLQSLAPAYDTAIQAHRS